jgi:hypothetical protein
MNGIALCWIGHQPVPDKAKKQGNNNPKRAMKIHKLIHIRTLLVPF